MKFLIFYCYEQKKFIPIILLYSGIINNDLAACVNLVPNVTSIYKWKGEINEDSEALMVLYIIIYIIK